MLTRCFAAACLVIASAGCGEDPEGGSEGSGAGSGAVGATGGLPSTSAGGATAAGTGGAVSDAPNAYSSSIPLPTYDCEADATAGNCVSIRGVINGTEVDKHCSLPQLRRDVLGGPMRWGVACGDSLDSNEIGTWYQIEVPLQEIGPFEHRMTAGDTFYGAAVKATQDGIGGWADKDNLEELLIVGEVGQNTDGYWVMSGTYRAMFSAGQVSCIDCAPADVHGSFHMINTLP